MSLADKISDLLSTTPAKGFDPDEEDADAKLTERNPDDLENDITTSEYRKRNADLLEDVDVKYAGRRSNRKNLAQRDWDSDTDDVPSSENDDGTTDSEVESDESHEPPTKEEYNVTPDGIIQVHASDTSSEVKKGFCVRNQLSIWENLLEIRIQLQKCLLTANKMPQMSTFNDIKTQSGEAFTSKVTETRKSVAGTLDKLLHLQELLLKQHPETKTNGNEEIQSDSDASEVVPNSSEEEQEEEEKMERPKKRRKLVHYEKTIAFNHEKYKADRNSVIQKWYDKTRIGVARTKSGNPTMHSILNQIEYHLIETKDKLRKRTQMKRSDYEILGEPRGDDDYNSEILDDDDFYHQLLRELIEVKSADVMDPVQLGQQWIRLQSLRSRMKRKIDIRATKGRKVRYTVHAKLVNFMAPIHEGSAWTDDAKTEFFGSLFGKSQTT